MENKKWASAESSADTETTGNLSKKPKLPQNPPSVNIKNISPFARQMTMSRKDNTKRSENNKTPMVAQLNRDSAGSIINRNRRVKFNENQFVEIVNVESYKEYNSVETDSDSQQSYHCKCLVF